MRRAIPSGAGRTVALTRGRDLRPSRRRPPATSASSPWSARRRPGRARGRHRRGAALPAREGRLGSAPVGQLPADDPRARRARGRAGLPGPDGASAAGVGLRHPHRPAEAAVRGDQGAGPRVRAAGCRPLPRQPDAAAGGDLSGPARDPVGDPAARRPDMPPILGDFADLPRGLVLVTGPTGSGKSTTLAAIIDKANRTRKGHIITIEDPIEFVHQHRQSRGQPARGGPGHDVVRGRAEARAAAGPRHHPRRRDARPRDDRDRAHRGRDGPPRLRHPAHQLGRHDHRPHHRRVPASQQQQIRTQLANSVQAVVCQALCRTVRRQGAGGGDRGHGGDAGGAQPHPRGQAAVDPVRAADRIALRHAHAEPGPRGPRREGPDHLRGSTGEGVRPVRAEPAAGQGGDATD